MLTLKYLWLAMTAFIIALYGANMLAWWFGDLLYPFITFTLWAVLAGVFAVEQMLFAKKLDSTSNYYFSGLGDSKLAKARDISFVVVGWATTLYLLFLASSAHTLHQYLIKAINPILTSITVWIAWSLITALLGLLDTTWFKEKNPHKVWLTKVELLIHMMKDINLTILVWFASLFVVFSSNGKAIVDYYSHAVFFLLLPIMAVTIHLFVNIQVELERRKFANLYSTEVARLLFGNMDLITSLYERHTHTNERGEFKYQSFMRAIYTLVSKRAPHLVALSKFVYGKQQEYRIQDEEVFVLEVKRMIEEHKNTPTLSVSDLL